MVRTLCPPGKTTLCRHVVTGRYCQSDLVGRHPGGQPERDAVGTGPQSQGQGSRLDHWVGAYAARTRGMTASEIRALFAVASRPEVVSLAGGMPYLSALPLDVVGATIGNMINERGAVALQYGSGQGDPQLREQILDVMAPHQIEAHPDEIVVTTGSQQALDLVTRIFVDPGDVVVAEAPSYVGALGVFSSYQAEIAHVPLDDDGLIPEALDETLTALRRAGRRVKLLYTVPNYHNPAGVTLSAARRPRILEIAERHDVLIVEDDPYGLLGFDGDPLPALRASSSEHVIYLGSFSKTFSPGVRVGWAVAPHAVREKLVLASEAAILCPSAFSQLTVSTYLETHDWKHQVGLFREMYRERRDAMIEGLEECIPQARRTHPQGGFYVWVTLPEGLDSKAMLPRAVTERVAYVPGTAFYADGQGRRHMRLSYCYPTPSRIREGIRRLATVVNAELELQETFDSRPGARPGGPGPRAGVQSPGPEIT
ncbi:MAG: PLP-dependent aminotransferase family protein [Actinomycetales bacterium]|nr:PLP-dependent aminotransferase family protein [Actinomycetales bacterium]